jgi:hypothetical protein
MVEAAVSASSFRSRAVVVWLLLLVLVAAIGVLEYTELLRPEPPSPTGSVPVFDFTEPDLGSVEVIYAGRSAALMRDARGQWLRHDTGHRHGGASDDGAASSSTGSHTADPEQAKRIATQLAVTARMIADRRIRPDREMGEYGLASPQVSIVFYRRTGDETDFSKPLDVLYVGDLLPTEYAYYARRNDDWELLLIPRYQIALLLALLFGEDQAPTPLPARAERSGG